jgi:23S rRNA pseudouridine955/2504/2580 synthase
LDKHTSGLLLATKSNEAYRKLTQQFQKRQVRKTYQTLVPVLPETPELEISAPIKEASGGKARIDFLNGKPSLTRVRLAEQFRHYSLLECEPVTGRMHQIRLHLAYIGSPIIGDSFYGGIDFLLSSIKRRYKHKRFDDEQPLNDGFLLHSAQIEFLHPLTNKSVILEAPLNENFALILKKLRALDAL